jgi:hypothetical protein
MGKKWRHDTHRIPARKNRISIVAINREPFINKPAIKQRPVTLSTPGRTIAIGSARLAGNNG